MRTHTLLPRLQWIQTVWRKRYLQGAVAPSCRCGGLRAPPLGLLACPAEAPHWQTLRCPSRHPQTQKHPEKRRQRGSWQWCQPDRWEQVIRHTGVSPVTSEDDLKGFTSHEVLLMDFMNGLNVISVVIMWQTAGLSTCCWSFTNSFLQEAAVKRRSPRFYPQCSCSALLKINTRGQHLHTKTLQGTRLLLLILEKVDGVDTGTL